MNAHEVMMSQILIEALKSEGNKAFGNLRKGRETMEKLIAKPDQNRVVIDELQGRMDGLEALLKDKAATQESITEYINSLPSPEWN